MARASLGEIRQSLRQFINGQLRIDKWTTNAPSRELVKVGSAYFPATSAVDYPANEVSFATGDFGITGKATIGFLIVFRFINEVELANIPIAMGEDVLCKMCLDALRYWADIHPAITSIKIPKMEPVLVSLEDTDSFLVLRPLFEVSYLADDPINIPVDDPYPFELLQINVNKSVIAVEGLLHSYDLDTTIAIPIRQLS
jgi:hypothetical protein